MSCAPPREPGPAAGRAAADFARIDWSAPWLAPYRAPGRAWQAAARAGEAALLDALNGAFAGVSPGGDRVTGRGRPLRFVPQAELPSGIAYETHIADTGCVPTRHNLHDFFNALVWFAYPRTKAALNARQAAAIDAAGGVGPVRGALRDALTLFDENAALFVTADRVLADALRGFDWPRLLVAARDAWGTRCEARLVGHALLEQLVAPYKSCTAHAWIVDVGADYFSWSDAQRRAHVDARIAAELTTRPLTSRDFAPLPVLGVPGWCAANADAAFYDDPAVFRRGRRSRAADGGAQC
ncbi:DUF3025 domain-containing protein [Burkholderia sp. AU42008]|uniref:DUF3025 domain-containing protein n=1 Tax=unclassified Burkholderia TaxID=2613784 RepID=UPI000B7AE0BD|nr:MULTISPECIES: DUF3025 domain-containing protein [unclassified Burkholderia]MBR8238125.1 DUF3025 domain-containing protein [Burkholderia sp. AU32357]MBY4872575.1 DUF3025 domain-containing protein [Burkholderia sp. AU42008]OXI44110.1 hypothetical protein CFB49_02985 [Burkholderia sp. AU17457]